MTENIKLANENKKAKKSVRLEEDNKVKSQALSELATELDDLKKKNNDKDVLIKNLSHIKEIWEKGEKDKKKQAEIKNKLEDENLDLKVKLEKTEKENKELKD